MADQSGQLQTLARFLATKETNEILKLDITDMLYVTVLFVIFSLPVADELLEKFLPITKSLVIRLAIKAGIFFVIIFIIIKIRHRRMAAKKH